MALAGALVAACLWGQREAGAPVSLTARAAVAAEAKRAAQQVAARQAGHSTWKSA